MTWLVTGGAGHIGSHVVAATRDAGERIVVVDDLSTGDPSRIAGVPLGRGSLLDQALLERTVREHAVTGVVHIAARKQVEQSVRRPLRHGGIGLGRLDKLARARQGADRGPAAVARSSSTGHRAARFRPLGRQLEEARSRV